MRRGRRGDENVRLLLHSAKSLDGVSSTEDYSALLYIASSYVVQCTVYSVESRVYIASLYNEQSMLVHCIFVECTVYSAS